MCERYLDLQAQGGSKKHRSVALVSRTEGKSSKKHNNKPKSNSESDSSKKNSFQGKGFKCGEKGHLTKDCLARIIAHPTQTGKSEADEDDSGEKPHVSYLECLLARRNDVVVQACEELCSMMYDVSGLKCLLTSRDDLILSAVNKDMIMNAVNKTTYFEDWYVDMNNAFHITDSLACIKDLKPCQKNVNGIGGVSCEVEFFGTLELVFVTADSELSAELKNVLYSLNLGYNLFSPKAQFDVKSWNGRGGPDDAATAFQGEVVFQNFDSMLIATAYRLGEYSIGTVLAALTPSNLKHETTMDVNEFHNIYAHSHEGLLRTTAKRQGTELVGDMHACTGCSMSKAIRKGISHEM